MFRRTLIAAAVMVSLTLGAGAVFAGHHHHHHHHGHGHGHGHVHGHVGHYHHYQHGYYSPYRQPVVVSPYSYPGYGCNTAYGAYPGYGYPAYGYGSGISVSTPGFGLYLSR